MITGITQINIYVLSLESASGFYVNKLGFRIVKDLLINNETRWLSVSPRNQPQIEIVLFPLLIGKWYSRETAVEVIKLTNKGGFGCGVLVCDNVITTCKNLKANGVRIIKPPTAEFYGLEALIADDSGNYFSLQQNKKHENNF